MNQHYIIADYLDAALVGAVYEALEDGTYCGRIPSCKGAVAFAPTLDECKDEMKTVIEDWVLLGLRFNDELPVIGGIDLNIKREPILEPVDSN